MKYIMIFIPVFYFLKLYNCDIIYISAIDLTIQKDLIMTLYLLAVLMWFTITKIKKPCYKNIVSAICHSFFIIELFSLMFLAQTSLWTVAFVLLMLIVVLFIFIKVIKDKNKLIRAYIVTGAVILAIPFVLVTFYYNLQQPVYIITPDEPQKEISVFKTKEEVLEENAEELQKILEWDSLNTMEKVEMMETIVSVETSYLGIKPIRVIIKEIEDDVLGMYYKKSRVIFISYDAVRDYEQCIQTLTHECFHAYQTHIMDNLDFKDEDISGCRYFAEAYSWWLNDKDYINDKDEFDAYVSQSLEISAEEYANKQVELYKQIIEKK